MGNKKYVVRDGFVVLLAMKKADGSVYERRHESGEEIQLDEDIAAEHAHKLEFAAQKDRDAALVVEKAADVASKAQLSPVDLVQALTAAFGQALTAAGVAPTPAPAPAPAA